MRNRHSPRLCPACAAPMASQDRTCWRCAAHWISEADRPPRRTKLRLVQGGASAEVRPITTAERLDRLRAEARR
jgi:hypothetical protein